MERTRELGDNNKQLEKINQKLIDQALEINQINSILDLDNWKLKNNIKEALESRFFNKNLVLDEFKKIFPDELACYRYLEKLKWPGTFCCKKCSNEKYFDGLQKFSKRCTKCGYNESITAYTIFHGLKFPIEKAFYITYISLSDHGKYTLEDLSKLLNLRPNTIWGFRNKINKLLKDQNIYNIKGTDWSEILIEVKAQKSQKVKPKIIRKKEEA
ncbi:MAG: transposase [Bacteroidota bacterium]|nr:transposase [Bacteroidota bacterium]